MLLRIERLLTPDYFNYNRSLFHHKALPKMFDNLFKYLKTSHSYDTRNRSNQNFFESSVNTNAGKKSIQ